MVPRVRKIQGSSHVEHIVTPERNSDSSVGTVTRLRTGRPMDGGSIRGRGSLLLCKRSRQSQSAGD